MDRHAQADGYTDRQWTDIHRQMDALTDIDKRDSRQKGICFDERKKMGGYYDKMRLLSGDIGELLHQSTFLNPRPKYNVKEWCFPYWKLIIFTSKIDQLKFQKPKSAFP